MAVHVITSHDRLARCTDRDPPISGKRNQDRHGGRAQSPPPRGRKDRIHIQSMELSSL